MGKTYDAIEGKIHQLIENAPVFFVATAPLAADGLLNVSPKGLDTLRVLDGRTVAYLDLTGSGAETIAHLRENGRIVMMFCTFEGPPKILRLYGRGTVLLPGEADYEDLAQRFPELPGARAIVRVACRKIIDSCGFGVPLMDYRGQRDTLPRYAEQKGPEGLKEYRWNKNRFSLDGLRALDDDHV